MGKDGKKDYAEMEREVSIPFIDANIIMYMVCRVIEKWLKDRGYEFKVRMISLDQVKGVWRSPKVKF